MNLFAYLEQKIRAIYFGVNLLTKGKYGKSPIAISSSATISDVEVVWSWTGVKKGAKSTKNWNILSQRTLDRLTSNLASSWVIMRGAIQEQKIRLLSWWHMTTLRLLRNPSEEKCLCQHILNHYIYFFRKEYLEIQADQATLRSQVINKSGVEGILMFSRWWRPCEIIILIGVGKNLRP